MAMLRSSKRGDLRFSYYAFVFMNIDRAPNPKKLNQVMLLLITFTWKKTTKCLKVLFYSSYGQRPSHHMGNKYMDRGDLVQFGNLLASQDMILYAMFDGAPRRHCICFMCELNYMYLYML